jgi:ATP-dependent exoDNAse (exonuclease V) beta subunit
MTTPIDQPQRTRFINELERNFSVVASAGSGKTRAITDRIVAMARHERALEWLPALVVVTYTNRAAAEMQQRARQSIIGADVRPEVLAAFNRAFFGTIHSLCMRLLRQHGHHLGLPGKLEHLDEGSDAALWTEFLQQHGTLGGELDANQRRTLLRLASAQKLMELGRDGSVPDSVPVPGPFPAFDFSEIHAFVPNGRSLAAVTRSREALARWERAWQGDGFAGPVPKCESKPLCPAWESSVAPLREWVQRAALHVAADTARTYRDFRLLRGAMTYTDQIALAAALLRDAGAAARIRAKGCRVILDEAQDTDPAQFDVLLEITRPPDATGAWLHGGASPPRAGHFCMVGDFQQSIYGARADLAHYRRIHKSLLETGAGEALEFSVTFRLDESGIGWVNAVFPALLHGQDNQVHFVQLNPRPAVLPGQIVRLDLGDLSGLSPDAEESPCGANAKDWEKARWEAERLAGWLRAQGLEKLRASSWSEVALLCPRTRWLPALRTALQRAGLKAQVQSERAIKGDSPAYAWFTALAVALAEPRNGYEIVGVLREVFGHSDQELADFAQGNGERFQLAGPNARSGPVAETLTLLAGLRERIARHPLFSAMEEMVRVTRLRERLLALPDSASEDPAAEIEDLLTQTATAEASEATLETFAADLRTAFTTSREVRATVHDAVQIISGHKAKGSEWDAVIVPYFARRVIVANSGYPRLLRDPRTREFVAAMDSGDIDADFKAALDTQARQELERLLYVAQTRARHTLAFVDDRALFSGKNGLPKNAQARLLGCAGADVHAAAFDALPDALSASKVTRAAQTAKAASRERALSVPPLAPCPGNLLDDGRERAAFFIKRNPSALAEAASAEADPAATPRAISSRPNAGQLYGTWWHGFVEHLDWRADPAAWDATFASAIITSPDAELSRREWALLREQLTNGSDLGRLLRAPGLVARAEMPFLWAMNDRECLEGIIDLAVFDPASGSWLILDWKTNRTTDADLPQLHAHYLPQLSAYWKAVAAMLAAPVTVGLYATATGTWLPYETSVLETEWQRVSTAPSALALALGEP